MLSQPLRSLRFSDGFLERIRETEGELNSIDALQKQVDAKSRELAQVWVSALREADLSIPIRKESFGIQFGIVDEASLNPEGMVTVKIAGNAVSYPLMELPSQTIISVVSGSAPEMLSQLRELVRMGSEGVDALEKLARDIDRNLGAPPKGSGLGEVTCTASDVSGPVGAKAEDTREHVASAGPFTKARAPKRKKDPSVALGEEVEAVSYAFRGSFGAPKSEALSLVLR